MQEALKAGVLPRSSMEEEDPVRVPLIRRRRAQGSVLMDCVDPRVSYNELVQGEIEYDADSGRPSQSMQKRISSRL